jgi:hypothetical protein
VGERMKDHVSPPAPPAAGQSGDNCAFFDICTPRRDDTLDDPSAPIVPTQLPSAQALNAPKVPVYNAATQEYDLGIISPTKMQNAMPELVD